jgi:gamma-butyrobetaine dioxygenase
MNNSHHLHQSHPTLELDPLQSKLGKTIDALAHVNYSPPFQAPLHMDTPAEFYDALKAFSDELDKPANVLRHRLQEGETVIFDNRRVLHARTAFGAAADTNEPEVQAWDKENDGLDQGVKEGESERWLKGCYIEADALEDRRRILENQREEKIL